MTGMAVPEPIDATDICYSMIAVLLSQVMLRNVQVAKVIERVYRRLGGINVVSF